MKVWRVEFSHDDEMDNSCQNEAVACKVERSNRSLPESGCFVTEGVCTFNTTNKYMEVSRASFRVQAWSAPGVLSTSFHTSYLFRVSIENQLYHP